MTKKLLCVLLAGLLMAFCLAGCAEETDYTEPIAEESDEEYEDESEYTEEGESGEIADGSATGDTWSIFIYLCGTDLESEGAGQATINIDELKQVSYNENVNIFAQTGGTYDWQTEDIDPNYLQRWQFVDGGMELLDEQELASMGDPQTLYDFLSWGVNNHPAEKMGVIFWNHGGGTLSGSEFDQVFDNDGLSLAEMEQAMTSVSEEMTDTFELIGFDTCLMATLENAHILSPFGKYLVSSEEIEPGGGWDYLAWGQYLSDNPMATGAELGQVICDSYYAKCEQGGSDVFATLSVVDLSVVESVVAAFETIADDLDANISDAEYFAEVARGASRAQSYGADTPGEGYTNQVDLGNLVQNTSENLDIDGAAELLSALGDAVLYQVAGSIHANASGLSVFFPMQVTEYDREALDGEYNDIVPSVAYKSFIDQTLSNKVEVEQAEDEFVVIAEEPYIDDDGVYRFTIDPDSLVHVEEVTFALYLESGGNYLYLGSDNDLDVDWDTGHVMDNFRGVWPTLNGQYVSFYIVENQDEFIVYSVPILLNGEQTNLRVLWVWDDPESATNYDGHFEVIGTWSGVDSETGMSSREIIQVADGDEITPLYYVEDGETGEFTLVSGMSFIVEGDLILTEEDLLAGDYWYAFEIIDVYGNITSTNYAVITIDENSELTIAA
jgi:hypothetical protein